MFSRTSYVTIGTVTVKNSMPFGGISIFRSGKWMINWRESTTETKNENEPPRTNDIAIFEAV